MLESVLNVCEVHDLSFLFFIFQMDTHSNNAVFNRYITKHRTSLNKYRDVLLCGQNQTFARSPLEMKGKNTLIIFNIFSSNFTFYLELSI